MCYRREVAPLIVQEHPGAAAVLVAFGTNDMAKVAGCIGTIGDFSDAMGEIIRTLHQIPNVQVFVGAILPRPDFLPEQIAAWNEVLAGAAQRNGATYFDPSVGISTDDFVGIHPNEAGHKHLARRWRGLLAQGRQVG
jgi:lysophospholipase L1-like esterase